MNWKPIETAPKTGESILAYFPLEGLSSRFPRRCIVYWSDSQRDWIFSGRAASGYSEGYNPTHWMPLPEPPKQD